MMCNHMIFLQGDNWMCLCGVFTLETLFGEKPSQQNLKL